MLPANHKHFEASGNNGNNGLVPVNVKDKSGVPELLISVAWMIMAQEETMWNLVEALGSVQFI